MNAHTLSAIVAQVLETHPDIHRDLVSKDPFYRRRATAQLQLHVNKAIKLLTDTARRN